MARSTINFLVLLAVCCLSLVTAIRQDPGTSTQLRSLKFSHVGYKPHGYIPYGKPDPYGKLHDGYDDDESDHYGKPHSGYDDDESDHYGKPHSGYDDDESDHYGKPHSGYDDDESDYYGKPDPYGKPHGGYDYGKPDPYGKPDRYGKPHGGYGPIFFKPRPYFNPYKPAPVKGYYDPKPKVDFYGCDPKSGYGCVVPHGGYQPHKPSYPSFGYNKVPYYGPKYPSYELDNKAGFSALGKHNLYGEGDLAQKFYGDSKSTKQGTEQNVGGFGASKTKGKFAGNLASHLDAETVDPYGRRNSLWGKGFNNVATKGIAKTNYYNDLASWTTAEGARTKGTAGDTLIGHGELAGAGGLSAETMSTGPKKHG